MITLTKIQAKHIVVTAVSCVLYRTLRACDRASVLVREKDGTLRTLEIYGCISDEKSLAKQAVNLVDEGTAFILTGLSPRLVKRQGKIESVYTVNELSEIAIM